MARRPPIFRDHGQVHRADTCQPLVDAVERGQLRLEALARGTYPGRPIPPGVVPRVKSVGFWDADHDQDWGLDEHRNEGIEFTYLERGQVAFCAEEASRALRPGDLTVTRPWQPHSVGNPHVTAGRLHWLILDVSVRQPHQTWKWPSWLVLSKPDLRELTDMLRHNEQPVWPGTDEVGHCFAELGRLVANAEQVATLGSRLAVHINELLVCVLETLRQRDVHREPALASAERTVAMFLAGLEKSVAEPWTLDSMAEHTGLRRTRFAHYCRKLTNMSPMQHLNQLRLKRAKTVMRAEPRRSLTDIALDSGFTTSQYFATVFRRLEGCSPREWRKGSD
jgi:AraC-like DNA-binding protein